MGGGGGVIRAIGKVAGIGAAAASRSIRGGQPASVSEHTARFATRNVPAIVSANGGGTVSPGDVSPVSVQNPAWEIDEWEFAGSEGELAVSSGEFMPRIVFGPGPSFREAKAATVELKDALEKVYLSSPAASEFENSSSLGHPFDQSSLLDSEFETKHLVFAENSVAPPAPKHVVQAFKMLTQNTSAQNVVASIASDPNVWDAVLQNEALVDFIRNEKACKPPNVESFVEEEPSLSTKNIDDSSRDNNTCEESENGLMSILHNMKHAVEEMVGNVSGFFQNIFVPKSEYKPVGSGDGGSTFIEATVGASFTGLAIMAILVILLRRA